MSIRELAVSVVERAIKSVLPEQAVKNALTTLPLEGSGSVVLVAIGKAAWRMANAAHSLLGGRISKGCVITKDGHSLGDIGDLKIFEAGHPLPDARNLEASRYTLSLVEGLDKNDTVLFLVSGGGSALFELPLDGISLDDLQDMTSQLLASGADIVEINTLRKRVSSVKGGRFALACMPAQVRSVVLSDVLGDRLDSIASGPAFADASTSQEALAIVGKYRLNLSPAVMSKLETETPKHLGNVRSQITGSVAVLCENACRILLEEGYSATLLTTTLDCEASSAGAFFAAMARESVRTRPNRSAPAIFIAGGETVVKLRGKGKGGRCQEAALAAALGMAELENAVFAAAGSDGTDGPTDAAGGVIDGNSTRRMKDRGVDPQSFLDNNDAYSALSASEDLLKTGPTGTNVNDLMLLIVT